MSSFENPCPNNMWEMRASRFRKSWKIDLASVKMSVVKKLIPLADRVLIRRVVAQKKTAGGIILPESSVSKNNEGQVVAVGPGATTRSGETIPVTVDVGDKVLLPEYGGLGVKLDGEEVFLFRNDEILAKFAA